MGLSEISAVSATVDTSETGAFNPDAVAADAILPSSEHIPVTRAAGITEVLAVPASGGFDSRGSANILGGQASAIHLAGWTINDMLIKKSVAMVLDWPKIETQSFDFATFSRKNKPFAEAKQEYEKQVNELSDWLDNARHYAQAWGHGGPADYQRDLKLEALVPVVRGELPVLVFADRARDIRSAVEFCDKQKLKMILAGGAEAYKVKELLRSKSIPVILQPTLTEPLDEDDPYDRSLTQPAELADARVKIAFGSFDNSFARRLGQQAANAVAYGLPYDEASKSSHALPRANLRPGRSNRHPRNRQNRQRNRHQRRSAGAHHRRPLPLHQRPANVHRQQTQIPLRQISQSPVSKVAKSRSSVGAQHRTAAPHLGKINPTVLNANPLARLSVSINLSRQPHKTFSCSWSV